MTRAEAIRLLLIGAENWWVGECAGSYEEEDQKLTEIEEALLLLGVTSEEYRRAARGD